jgi:plastocyanin
MTASALGIQVIVDGQTIIFEDVAQSSWYSSYVRSATEANIATGYRDANGKLTGKFGPSNNVTIAEALKMASESAGYDETAYGAVIDSGVNHWASSYISVAKAERFPIMQNFVRIDRAATRAEVASIFAAAFLVNMDDTAKGTTFKDVAFDTNYGTAVEALARDKVVSGDTMVNGQVTGTFRPTDAINRAEVVKIAMNARATYGQPGQTRKPVTSSEAALNTVLYRDTGFTPSVLRVKVGTVVTFRNDSGNNLRVASNPHPWHTDYPEFDSGGAIASGAEFKFTFTKKGTWGYHNHFNSTHTATIVVE